MIKKLLLLSIILLSGCGHTNREKMLFMGMVAAQFADGYTTNRNIDAGGTELNPILGKHPSRDNIILFKSGVVGLLYGLGQIFPEHREEFYMIGIASGGGAAVWNQYQYNKYK